MKHLKMLGLAAIAALGLMAFVGAGTASATTLYTSSNLTNPYPAHTTFHSESTSIAILTDGNGNKLVECKKSTVHGETSTESGTPLSGSIGTLTFGECNTTVDVLANGSLSIEKTGTNEGSVSGSGSQVTVNIFGVTCTYGTGSGTKLGTITGGVSPVLNIAAVGLTKVAGGFLCPSNAGWDATYTVDVPHAVFIG